MTVDPLFLHLVEVVRNKRQPAAVGTAVLRRFQEETLQAAGDRDTAGLDDAALEARWQARFWDARQQAFTIDFSPAPSPYDVIPCYAQVLRGLGYFQAVRYEATTEGLTTRSQDGESLEHNPHLAGQGRRALRVMAEADALLREAATLLEGENGAVTLLLELDSSRLAAMHDAYKALQPEGRGLAGTSDELRQAILRA